MPIHIHFYFEENELVCGHIAAGKERSLYSVLRKWQVRIGTY